MSKTNFNQTPILNTLQEYLSKKPLRMHVPFHCGNANNDIFPKGLYGLDVSEVSGYDLEGEDNPIFQSEKVTASYFNVEHSFYLTGGASIGLVSAMIALRKYGRKVILARNVHKSVINGVILAGLEPLWLDVDFDSEWGVYSKVNPDNLSSILKNNSDIAGCVIVSPTYEGVISNVEVISQECHKNNIPLIVDEAHGGHLFFLGDVASRGIACNASTADIVIQSWHKSLGSLTQSGVMHLVNNKYFTYDDLKRSLDLVSSTSPSFLVLLSLELTRKFFAVESCHGMTLRGILNLSMLFKQEIKQIQNIFLFENDDPLKIYLKSNSLSGIDFAYKLYKDYSIEIESANEIGFLMLIGSGFNKIAIEKIINAMRSIMPRHDATVMINLPKPTINEFTMLPRNAFFAGFKKNDYAYECNVKAPCPPGYALKIPGSKK